jgi:hypothetical protein
MNNVAAFYADHLICPECWKLHATMIDAALAFIHKNADARGFTFFNGLLLFTPDRIDLLHIRRMTKELHPVPFSPKLPMHRPAGKSHDHDPHAETAAARTTASDASSIDADARRDPATD